MLHTHELPAETFVKCVCVCGGGGGCRCQSASQNLGWLVAGRIKDRHRLGRCRVRWQRCSSSSVGATTLGGFWPALRFRSTIFYLHTSLSSSSLSSSLNPLLLAQAISILVFLLFLMNMVPIHLIFLTVLVVSILITCAAQRNLHCDFINLTIFFLYEC